MKIPQEKSFLTLPVPSVLKIIELRMTHISLVFSLLFEVGTTSVKTAFFVKPMPFLFP